MQGDANRKRPMLPTIAPVEGVAAAKPKTSPEPAGQQMRSVQTGGKVSSTHVEVDPYEIAYLRGGDREVLILHLFDLIQRGYLEVVETKNWLSTDRQIAVTRIPPPYGSLNELDCALVSRFEMPKTAKDFSDLHRLEPLKSASALYRGWLEARGLVKRPLTRAEHLALSVGIFAVSIALAPAIGIFVAFIAFVAANIAANRFFNGRTQRGRDHLKELKSQFEFLKLRAKTARLDTADPSLVMAVAVFGTPVLAGSVYDAFAAAVAPNGTGWTVELYSWGDGDGDGDGGCGGCGGCG
jgi:uncharacterized protein (TIGR04222 family)